LRSRFAKAAATAAQEMGVKLDREVLLEIIKESQTRYHSSIHILAEEYGLSRRDLHKRYHEICDANEVSIVGNLSGEFKAFFMSCGLMTHSSRGWAERILDRCGVRDRFEGHIYGFEDYDFLNKSLSAKGYEMVLKNEGVAPSCAVIVEDSPKNLFFAHELGMLTVLTVGNAKIDLAAYPHVDFTVRDVRAFVKAAADLHPVLPLKKENAGMNRLRF
jgi:FMN phosphatase YigB (HAD superfamily)